MGTATELYLAKTPSLLALLIPLLTFAFLHNCPLNRFLGSCANLSMGCVIGEIGATDGTIESIPPSSKHPANDFQRILSTNNG